MDFCFVSWGLSGYHVNYLCEIRSYKNECQWLFLVKGLQVIFLLIFAFLHVLILFTIKLIWIIRKKTHYDLGISMALLNNTPKAPTKRKKIDNLHGIKTKICEQKLS